MKIVRIDHFYQNSEFYESEFLKKNITNGSVERKTKSQKIPFLKFYAFLELRTNETAASRRWRSNSPMISR